MSKRFVMIACFVALLGGALFGDTNASYPPHPFETQGGKRAPTFSEANAESISWLTLIDQGQYEASWSEAGSLLQDTVTRKQWTAAMKGTRRELGYVSTRKVNEHHARETLSGGTKGTFMVITYGTDFYAKSGKTETVTLMLDRRGAWRVISYSIN